MRCNEFLLVADAFADHKAADQPGDTGVDVHHGAASKI